MSTENSEITWLAIKEAIDKIASDYDKIWRQRSRKIDSKFLINFIFQLVLNSDKGYGIILSEVWDEYETKKIKVPQKNMFSSSSICEARQKFPEDIFKLINEKIMEIFTKIEHDRSLEGHRIFAIDGSKVSLQKRLEEDGFKKFNHRAYYPSGLLSCLYDVDTHFIHDFAFTQSFSERDRALEHIEKLEPKTDVVIFDRGYFSFLLLRKIMDKNAHAIFRLQGNLRNREILKFIDSSSTDKVIDYVPSKTVQSDLRKIGHDIDFSSIKLRVLKQEIEGQTYIFGTTLMGNSYPKNIFGDLYHKRWDIEELFKTSKILLNLENLHSKMERGVRQEVYANFVLINLSRWFEIKGNRKNSLHYGDRKLNFKGCISGLRRYVSDLLFKGYEEVLFVVDKIFLFISKMKYKVRPNRKFPRVSYKPARVWGAGRDAIINAA